ncbi:MAG: efflux RND transporter periplasmic adaptor subunit [Planctomycetota bacterium]|nr:efflux RND transporter periplasmic adaptor subunit [Planctomycetota bacterium]
MECCRWSVHVSGVWRRWRFLLVSSVLATVCWSWAAVMTAARPVAEEPAADFVELAPVLVKQVKQRHPFVGTATAHRISVVGSAVDGRVETVSFREGDRVEFAPVVKTESSTLSTSWRGPALVQLRTGTVQLELEGEKAELKYRQQAQLQLQQQLPAELKQAEAKLAAAEARSRNAQSRFTRTERLYRESQTATKEELDEADSDLRVARQTEIAARSARQQIEVTRESRLAQAAATVSVQREKVRRLEDILQKYTIRAPFAGYVTKLYTEVGAWIKQGDPIVEVIELDPIEIHTFVPEKFIDRLQPGDRAVSLKFEALPKRTFQAVITRLVPQADPRSRTFPVKLEVENKGFQIKAGMLARLELAVGQQKGLWVDKDALVLKSGVRYVIVADATTRAHRFKARQVKITVGLNDGNLVEVTGDLSERDRVVVSGNERLAGGEFLTDRAPRRKRAE